jgi:WhiB family redox-sensing transcriptional regulator
MTWREQAACRTGGHDPDLWFPRGYSAPYEAQVEQARAVCRTCPVFQACEQWALGTYLEYGITAAMTPDERRRERHRLAPRTGPRTLAPCGTSAAYRRHKKYGEPIDEVCDQARRVDRAAEMRRSRAARRLAEATA